MSDLIEAMAMAMQAESANKPFRWENAAHAALRAMRDHGPSEAMVEAGSAAIQATGFTDEATITGWDAMLNAAITEAEERDDA